MHVTSEAVSEIAHCARIELNDDELEEMTRNLNAIIDSLKPITGYELEGVAPTFHPIAGRCNVMREDSAMPGLTQDEALENAPASQDGQYKIPPILANGGGDR